MQKEDYLGYIAYFVKNIDQLTSTNEYRTFFVKHLGTSNIVSAPDAKIRDVARHLYKAYVAGLYIRYSPYYLVSTLTSKQISELITDQTALIDKYGLYKSIDADITISNIDRHIRKSAMDTYRSILSKYLPEKPKAAPRSKPVAKKIASKPAARKTAAKPSVKKTVARKPAQKTVAKKTVPKKVLVTKGKVCREYGVPQLKEMAKAKGLTRYSKMNKNALCNALSIRQ